MSRVVSLRRAAAVLPLPHRRACQSPWATRTLHTLPIVAGPVPRRVVDGVVEAATAASGNTESFRHIAHAHAKTWQTKVGIRSEYGSRTARQQCNNVKVDRNIARHGQRRRRNMRKGTRSANVLHHRSHCWASWQQQHGAMQVGPAKLVIRTRRR